MASTLANLGKASPICMISTKMGVVDRGKQIDTDLPFDKLGEIEFVERLIETIVTGAGIGEDIAEGFTRAAARWMQHNTFRS